MPSDDILDLLGRYASGSLSSDERKRLFDAALDDQDLFDQVAREADLKAILDKPGVRARMIRALEPPRRTRAWIFGVAATVAASLAILLFLRRQTPKPAEVSVAKLETPDAVQSESAPQPLPVLKSQPPVAAPKIKAAPVKKEVAVAQPANRPARDANRELDQVTVASAPSPPPPVRLQQNAVGGRRQLPPQASAALPQSSAFGFHYSVQTPGHLSIIPATDGFVFVKSADGAVLFGPQDSAAGMILDIPLPDAVHALVITFSSTAAPVQTPPVAHNEPEANIAGTPPLAISVTIR